MDTQTNFRRKYLLLILVVLLVLILVRGCTRENHLTTGNQAMHTMHVYEQLVCTGEYLLTQGEDLGWFAYLNQHDAVMKLIYGPSNASISGVSKHLHRLIAFTFQQFQLIGDYVAEGLEVPQEELDRAMEYCQVGQQVCSVFNIHINIATYMDHPDKVIPLGKNISRMIAHGYFLDEDFQLLQQRVNQLIPGELLSPPNTFS